MKNLLGKFHAELSQQRLARERERERERERDVLFWFFYTYDYRIRANKRPAAYKKIRVLW